MNLPQAQNDKVTLLPKQGNRIHIALEGDIEQPITEMFQTVAGLAIEQMSEGDILVIHFEPLEFNLEHNQKYCSYGAAFCDEYCVAIVLWAWKNAREKGGDLHLVAYGHVFKSFQQKGLDTIISTYAYTAQKQPT